MNFSSTPLSLLSAIVLILISSFASAQLVLNTYTAPTTNPDSGIFRRSNFNTAWQNATIILVTPATLPSGTCSYFFNGTGAGCPALSWTPITCLVDQPRQGSFDTTVTIDTKNSVGILAGPNPEFPCSYHSVVIKVAGGNTIYYGHIPINITSIERVPEITRIDVVGGRILVSNPGASLKFRAYGIDLPTSSRFTAGTASMSLNMSAINGITPVPNCGNIEFTPLNIVNTTDGGLEVTYNLPSYISGCKIDVWSIRAPTYGAVTAPVRSTIYMYSTVPTLNSAVTPYLATQSRQIGLSGTDIPLPSSYAEIRLSVSGGNCGGVPTCSSLSLSGSEIVCNADLSVITGDALSGCAISGTITEFPRTAFNTTFSTVRIATAIKTLNVSNTPITSTAYPLVASVPSITSGMTDLTYQVSAVPASLGVLCPLISLLSTPTIVSPGSVAVTLTGPLALLNGCNIQMSVTRQGFIGTTGTIASVLNALPEPPVSPPTAPPVTEPIAAPVDPPVAEPVEAPVNPPLVESFQALVQSPVYSRIAEPVAAPELTGEPIAAPVQPDPQAEELQPFSKPRENEYTGGTATSLTGFGIKLSEGEIVGIAFGGVGLLLLALLLIFIIVRRRNNKEEKPEQGQNGDVAPDV